MKVSGNVFSYELADSVPPDPEDMNNQRADAALQAVESFAHNFGEAIDEPGLLDQNLSDLLADMCHLCDRAGIDFTTLLSRARTHYDEETGGKGDQLPYLINLS